MEANQSAVTRVQAIAAEQLAYVAGHHAEGLCIATECPECGVWLACRELLFDRFKQSEFTPASSPIISPAPR